MKIIDIAQRLEIDEKKRRTLDVFKKSIISKAMSFFSIISLQTNNNGMITFRVDPTGFVHKSYNNISSTGALATLVRKPLQGQDTVRVNVIWDQWATLGSNFVPELKGTDTLECYVIKDTLGRRFSATTWLTGGGRLTLETCLKDPNKLVRGFTPQIWTVKDTSRISGNPYGIFWLKKNSAQKCTALVDTTFHPRHVVDFYINAQLQDSNFVHGDSAYIQLEKIFNGVRYFTKIGFKIDTTYWDAMLVKSQGNTGNSTVYFPLAKESLVGIGENLERKVEKTQLLITPISSNGFIKFNQEVNGFLYDAMGNKVMTFNSDELDLRKLPKGIYFIKPEDEKYKPEKIIYLK